MKVLIAEDDNITSEILTETIRKWGFNPVPVDDGDKALNVLHMQAPPPIALLDWRMPKKDGFEVLKIIRSSAEIKDTYVILLTSVSDPESVTNAIKAQANDYIVKPYDSDDLHARLIRAKEFVVKYGLEKKAPASEVKFF